MPTQRARRAATAFRHRAKHAASWQRPSCPVATRPKKSACAPVRFAQAWHTEVGKGPRSRSRPCRIIIVATSDLRMDCPAERRTRRSRPGNACRCTSAGQSAISSKAAKVVPSCCSKRVMTGSIRSRSFRNRLTVHCRTPSRMPISSSERPSAFRLAIVRYMPISFIRPHSPRSLWRREAQFARKIHLQPVSRPLQHRLCRPVRRDRQPPRPARRSRQRA